MTLNEAKLQVIEAGKELVKLGLIARTWGNVSCRVDHDHFVITPSGRDYLSLTPDEIVKVKIEDGSYEGLIKPSSEKGAHAQVYQLKADANFVIHTHQENASILSACSIHKIKVSHDFTYLKGEIMCTGYGLPSTKKLAKKIAEVLKNTDSQGLLLKNHGALCYGRDDQEAFNAALELEEASLSFIKKRFSKVSHMTHGQVEMEDIYQYLLEQHDQFYLPRSVLAPFDRLNRYEHFEVIDSPEVMYAASLGKAIRPMVDDFAQIVGLKVVSVSNNLRDIRKALKKSAAVLVPGLGAICCGNNKDDLAAVSMIVKKTCKAQLCAQLFGKAKPINMIESKLMNVIYRLKYSKQKVSSY